MGEMLVHSPGFAPRMMWTPLDRQSCIEVLAEAGYADDEIQQIR